MACPGRFERSTFCFRGPAPVAYVFDSSSSVMHAESAFCLVFGGFRTVLGPNFFFGVWQGACVRNESPRADSIFPFIIFSFALRRLAGATIEPRTRPVAPLVSDGNNRSIAMWMAFSPVSVKVAFAVPSIRTFGKEGPVEAGPSCHELKPDLLVISISCADRSTDLAAWGASAVHIDVGGSFTHRLHDFCKVRAGRNALTVGSNYIGRCN